MAASSSRLAYIDWLRGLACVLMFQTHCYDAWLGGAARNSRFAVWSQLLGTFPAPLFLFLAGISVALITDRLLQKRTPASQIAKRVILRGSQILGLGLLFRFQEFAISWGWAPWSDLFRVDILNTIGVSIMLMGALCWCVLIAGPERVLLTEYSARGGNSGPVGPPNVAEHFSSGEAVKSAPVGAIEHNRAGFNYTPLVVLSIATAAVISAITPLLWTTWRLNFLPWELESYINGVHNLNTPQAWLFPIFPWTGFAFAGLALGFVLVTDFARRHSLSIFLACGAGGLALIYVSKFIDSRGWQLYPVYDYWHTSPSFFILRVGWLLIFILVAYLWCRWGLGQFAFSPLIQLGTTSLLVYWVHIEFVYGRFSILHPDSQTILGATKGLLIIFVSMLLLSLARREWKKRAPRLLSWGRSAKAAVNA